ncbi:MULTISPECIES: hypothetical protein [Streptomyces]|uniref:Uncharacterized protein n=1 Tax=Streptomyces sp. 900129855 TaxID=3155129 RepID=A0ABV3A137_9ACTN
MGCEAVEQALEEHVVACRGEVDRLCGEAERIGKLLADREHELERLLTARQVLAGLPGVHSPTVEVKLPGSRPGSRACWPVVRIGGRPSARRSPPRCWTCWVRAAPR